MSVMTVEERCARIEASLAAYQMLIASALALCSRGEPNPVAALELLGRALVHVTMTRVADAMSADVRLRNAVTSECAESVASVIEMARQMMLAQDAGAG